MCRSSKISLNVLVVLKTIESANRERYLGFTTAFAEMTPKSIEPSMIDYKLLLDLGLFAEPEIKFKKIRPYVNR